MPTLAQMDRPPSRMAELLVAASDTAKLGPAPEGDLKAYHGTAGTFLGPPQPPLTTEPGDWEIPGVFVSSSPDVSYTYMGFPLDARDDVVLARRMFTTRLDPSRIFAVQWLPDQPPSATPFNQAQARTYDAVDRRLQEIGPDRRAAWERFRQQYDAVMPPPYEPWGTLDSPPWQAIMINPRYDDLLFPHPGIDDFSSMRMSPSEGLVSVSDALDQYAERGGAGYEWAADIVGKGSRMRRNPSRGREDYYDDRRTYQLYRDRNYHLREIEKMAARQRQGARSWLSQGERDALRHHTNRLEMITRRITPKSMLHSPEAPTAGRSMIAQPRLM